MRKIVMMLIALSTLAVSAQRNVSTKGGPQKEVRVNYTPEQRAILRTKQLSLSLDLSNNQQKQVQELLQNNYGDKTDRSNWKTMTSEQRFEAKSANLDRRIEIKRGMKDILSPEQYTKWEKESNLKQVRSKRKHTKRVHRE